MSLLPIRVTNQRLKCANISYVAHLLHHKASKGVENHRNGNKLVIAWALLLIQDMLAQL